jgi:putative ABC transport system substrate-binding protein
LEVHVLNASKEADFDSVFAKMSQVRAGALVIGGGPFLAAQRERLGALTLQRRVPAAYQNRDFTAAGGLMSYGSDITDSYRLAGIYTGRILKGEKPADLPVQQAVKLRLYINLKTAKALGVSMPLTLLGRADEVIE